MNEDAGFRVYVFGASGSGVTTLGAEVASALGLVHVDCDDHFWAPTEPPFSKKRTPVERITSMRDALGDAGWVLTGACNSWGAEVVRQADLIVFVTLPTPMRLERVLRREQDRFGSRIEAGGDMFSNHKDFLAWASEYDDPEFGGRNLAKHESWLQEQTTQVCRVDGDQNLETSVVQVLTQLERI